MTAADRWCIALALASQALPGAAAAEWPASTPSAEGVDAATLATLDTEIAAGQHGNIDGLLVIRHGKVVFERRYARDYAAQNPDSARASHPYNYYDPHWHPWYHGNTELHTMQSVSKSVLAVLYGIAQQQGLLPALDTPALALLKRRRVADLDDRKAAITLRDLLTMRSGIAWDEDTVPYTDPRNDCAAMEASGDWVQFVLDKPMAVAPGSTWVYSSGITMLLAEILEELTGRPLAEYAQAELFKPLGIHAAYWKRTPTGLPDAEGGLYLAPRDIAKIVRLYLDEGRVDGRQLVSRDWVRESLAPATPSTYPEDPLWKGVGYGYQWWVYGDYLGQPAWGGRGFGGQVPIAVPGMDLIVVLTSWNIYGPATEPLKLVRDRILPAVRKGSYRHAQEPIGTVEQIYDGALMPDEAVATFRNIDRIFPTRTIRAGGRVHELPLAERQLKNFTFEHDGATYDLYDVMALDNFTALLVLKDGEIAFETYQRGNNAETRWMSMSVAKSVTSTLTAIAIKEGLIAGLDALVTDYVPSLKGSAYDRVSVRDVLMMASGVQWNEAYSDPSSDRRALLRAQISQVPGSAMAVMAALPRAAQPGTVNNYSTGETQVLGEIVRSAVGKPLAQYLSEKIWVPYGMEADANWWLDSPDGVEIGGSGISATLRDYGRFGQFFLEGGKIDGVSILPEGWTREATSPTRLKDGSALEYGYMWWTGRTGPSIADGAYAAVGIQGQRIYINPTRRVVIVTFGAQPKPKDKEPIDPMVFFDAVAESLD